MKEVTVKLCDEKGKPKSYKLGFGTKALRTYERDGGRSIVNLQDDFGVGTIVYLLHAGMVYEYPELTLDDVDNIVDTFLEDGGDITPIIGKVVDTVVASGWFQPTNPTTAKASPSGKDSGETPAV
jgi:hypothetical protein